MLVPIRNGLLLPGSSSSIAKTAISSSSRSKSEAIAKGDVQAVNYFVAQKYVEALQTIGTAPNQKLIFMPMEASGVIGAIGGVAELAKSAMAKDSA